MQFCVKCGSKMKNLTSSECKSCSGTAKTPIVDSTSPVSIDDKTSFPEIPFSQVVVERKENSKKIATELKATKKQELKRAREKKLRATIQKFHSKKKISYPLALCAIFLILWTISQAIIYSSSSPTEITQKYISAINSGDWSSLNDEILFPRNDQTPILPVEIRGIRNAKQSFVELVGINRNGEKATITILHSGREEYEIIATFHLKFNGLFFTPEWEISSPPPTASVNFDNLFSEDQLTNAEIDGVLTTVGDMRDRYSSKYLVLPGVYEIKVNPAGYLQTNIGTASIFAGGAQISVAAKNFKVPAVTLDSIESIVESAAQSCFSSKCSHLGNWDENDFDFWSRYPYDEYTYSTFDWHATMNRCGDIGIDLLAYNSVSVNSSCSGKIQAHLYIKYVYYQGWYSSYWYYWNYNDTANTYFDVDLVSTTDFEGTSQEIGIPNISG
jgi:hypothetical protein